MPKTIRFEIIDQGISFKPAKKRFIAKCPGVYSRFGSRQEAVTWLQSSYKLIADLEGFPLQPIPDFRKIDWMEVQL